MVDANLRLGGERDAAVCARDPQAVGLSDSQLQRRAGVLRHCDRQRAENAASGSGIQVAGRSVWECHGAEAFDCALQPGRRFGGPGGQLPAHA